MSSLVDSAKLVAWVLVSSALQFFSRTIRIRPAIHRVVKVFDRGQAKVCVQATAAERAVQLAGD